MGNQSRGVTMSIKRLLHLVRFHLVRLYRQPYSHSVVDIDKEIDNIGPTVLQQLNAEAILNRKSKGNPFLETNLLES